MEPPGLATQRDAQQWAAREADAAALDDDHTSLSLLQVLACNAVPFAPEAHDARRVPRLARRAAAPFAEATDAGLAYHRAMRLLLATALLLSACAAESANGPGAQKPRSTVNDTVCQDEQPTGTAITRRVCRGPEQREIEEAAKQSWMTGWNPHNPMRGDLTYPGVDLRHPPPPPSTETTYVPPSPPPSPPPD